MKIGMFIHWPLGSLRAPRGNVLGDELYATSLARALRATGAEADVYGPNKIPEAQLDWLIHFNESRPVRTMARRHLLYLQNAYGEGADKKLRQLRTFRFDGYAFISRKLLDLHREDGFEGLFLPFGVDTSEFHPKPLDPRFEVEVAYVGNDIKGRSRTEAYLLPAADFDFALYGNWNAKLGLRFWRRRKLEYQKIFAKISRGKIAQEDVPALYSSAKINLNCTAQDCVDWDVITLRTLEVLACKGFLISDRVPSAETLLGGGIVFTSGRDDLQDKIAYYLSNEVERRAIAKTGYNYVVTNASISVTANKLLGYLESL